MEKYFKRFRKIMDDFSKTSQEFFDESREMFGSNVVNGIMYSNKNGNIILEGNLKSLRVNGQFFEVKEPMNTPRWCNFCQKNTPTKKWICTACEKSKPATL